MRNSLLTTPFSKTNPSIRNHFTGVTVTCDGTLGVCEGKDFHISSKSCKYNFHIMYFIEFIMLTFECC